MQRVLTIIVLLAIVVAAGLFYAAPIISFYDIRSAAQSQDIQSLSRLIDFDKLRASLKPQLEAGDEGVSAPPPNPMNDPVGATGDFLKRAADSVGKVITDVLDPNKPVTPPKPVIDVESYLKPQSLLALTYGYGEDANSAEPETFPAKAPMPAMAFFSLDHARLTVTDEPHGKTTFTFERKGIYRWQLVHVGLPGSEIVTESDAESSSTSSVSPN